MSNGGAYSYERRLKPVVVSDFSQVDRVAERLSRITGVEISTK
jgi:hypothetical protein